MKDMIDMKTYISYSFKKTEIFLNEENNSKIYVCNY